MSYRQPARRARRSPSTILTGLIVVSAALAALLSVFVLQSVVSSSCSAASPIDLLPVDHHGAPPKLTAVARVEDGAIPSGVTVFDDQYPAVANLDPDLLTALRQAATAASDEGIELYANSGWRSPQYQAVLFDEAVSECGSAQGAAHWVATADTSAHVRGTAIDLGPVDATTWLAENGSGYGLCQIYVNEPWHYELRPDAVEHGCPDMYVDPTHDPRMQE
ncbi:MAG TPA: M15 family metallopeptidase [Dehalococcoidia bacterium]|nr:M15 family metallopeptidase [Dehalococcoidia bacterium]